MSRVYYFLVTILVMVHICASQAETLQSEANNCTSEKSVEKFKLAMKQQEDFLERELNRSSEEKWETRCVDILNSEQPQTILVDGRGRDYFLGEMSCISLSSESLYRHKGYYSVEINGQTCRIMSFKKD